VTTSLDTRRLPASGRAGAPATDDYVQFCDSLRDLCGVDLGQYKRRQMERRLRTFFARQGVERLTDGIAALRRDPVRLDALLDRITINVSQLWRNPEQWELLQRELLPGLAADGRLDAWSAGCSYGAESYTLAAICAHILPAAQVRILGTDIDRRMVTRANAAVFSPEDARSAPRADLERWFERIEDGWLARPALRAVTRFEVGDLLNLRVRPASYDLILCRNTVIYFAKPVRDELHARLAGALRAGGCLVIGSTERVSNPTALGLRPVHPFIYRKT
jgi:chemotaxis protein methyltransferase CheR